MYEQRHLEQLVQQEAIAIQTAVNHELTNLILPLQRLSKRWQTNGGMSRKVWQIDVTAYLQDYQGYQAIEWVDASNRVRWILPIAGNQAFQKLDLSREPLHQTALQTARSLRRPVSTRAFSLAQGGTGFLVAIPLFVGDRFDGFIVGVFQFQSLFESILPVLPGYQVRIYDGTELIYQQGTSALLPPQRTVMLTLYGVKWQIDVFPSSILLAEARSPLPTVVLVGGLTSVWLLVLVIYLAQGNYRRIRQSQQANHQLQQEIHYRQQIETALQASQSRFAGILDIANDAIISVDSNQQITLFNQGAEQIFGYTAEEVLGQSLNLLLPERFAQAHQQHMRDFAQTTCPSRRMAERNQIFGRRKDGTEFPAEATISRLSLNGEVIFTTFLRDISVRQQAEQALQQSEARFQAFMNHSPMAAWITDREGIIVYANQTYLQSFRLPTDNIIGKSLFDVYPSALAQSYLNNIQTVADTQQMLEAIEEAPRSDGSLGKFLVYKFPLSDAFEQPFVGGMAIDLTDRQQAEAELREMTAVLENVVTGISRLDGQGQYLYVNKAYASITGYHPEEMVGMPWQQTVCPNDVERMITAYQQMVQEGRVEVEATGIRKDGAIFHKHLVMIAIYDEQEQLLGHYCFMKDISDRKRIEVELRQAKEAAEAANLAKSLFLANMSHELRTPLNVILGFAQVMAHDPALTPSQQEDLQTIHRSGDHLLSLINEILDLSKIEAGHCVIEETGFDLLALLQALRRMLADWVNSKGLQLHFEIDPEVPQFILADAQKLRQILLNLLGNAIKFTQQGSITLRVHCDRRPLQPDPARVAVPRLRFPLTFQVIDTGIGIGPADCDRIFDAFAQAHAGKRVTNGTGLGLTISRKLLELMDGEITVNSGVGQGSTFTFTIPVCQTSHVSVEPALSDRRVLGLAPGQPDYRILVVDDQPENRLLIVKLLTQIGLQVRAATNGQEAVHAWQEWQPDLTWMDIYMPVLDGYEATRQIRAIEKKQTSIIIALTAQASQSDRALALAAGCNDYISKPFQSKTLFLKMTEYLGLQYVYAEPGMLTQQVLDRSTSPLPKNQFNWCDPTLLVALPPELLTSLENAAVRGDDRAMHELIAQLPPTLATLATQLKEFAANYQFEQIIQLLQHRSNTE